MISEQTNKTVEGVCMMITGWAVALTCYVARVLSIEKKRILTPRRAEIPET